MTDMREAVARAKLRWNWPSLADTDIEEMLPDHIGEATAIFDAIQPEIDRRVAEERAKLLEQLREPSENALRAGCNQIDWERIPQEHMPTAPNGVVDLDATFLTPGATTIGRDMLDAWQAMLVQFEKENSHEQG